MSEDKAPSEMVEELRRVASLEGSEVGEQWESLAMAETAAMYGSSGFKAAWEKEVREEYDHFISNWRLVTRTETREVEYTVLEFVG